MKIRLLNLALAKELYKQRLKKDFIPEELKPFKSMEKLYSEGHYEFIGYYENNALCAYSFMVITPNAVLVDYFAVKEELRSSGIGSKAIATLIEHYGDKCVILESECPEMFKPFQKEKIHTATRRQVFYERNGMNRTQLSSELFGVKYDIFTSYEMSTEKAEILLKEIYETMFSKLFKNRVKMYVNNTSVSLNLK